MVVRISAPTSSVEAMREACGWVLELRKAPMGNQSLRAMRDMLKEFIGNQDSVMKARLDVEYAARFGGSL